MKSVVLMSIFACLLYGCASNSTSEKKFEMSATSAINTTEYKIDGNAIKKIREEWKYEMVSASGEAAFIEKYDNFERNKLLARRGALMDAQRNLSEKINKIYITGNTTINDFAATDIVRSRVEAVLKDVEVISENFDSTRKIYSLTIQMPKLRLVDVIEESIR